MKKKKFTAAIASAAVMLTCLAGCVNPADKVRLGTGGQGGTYRAYGEIIGEIYREIRPKAVFEKKETAGSAANVRLLSDEYLELAIVQSDVADEAYHGTGMFLDDPRTGYLAVASLYTEPCQIVVRADSEIHTMDDLLGKRVSVGEEGSGVLHNAQVILECCGLSPELLEESNLSFAEAAKALQEGTIDAFFCTAGIPTNAVAELARQVPVRLLSLDEHQTQRLLKTSASYIPTRIPADTYPGQQQEVSTVGVRAVLLADDRMKEEEIYDLLGAIYENRERFQTGTDADTELVLGEYAAGVTIPFHPGAVRFFQEQSREG